MIFLKYLLLVKAIVYTLSNIAKVILKQIWLMAIGIVGYAVMEFKLGY